MIFKLNFSMVNSDNLHVQEAFLDYIKKTAFTFVSTYRKILDVAVKTAKKELFSNNSAAEVMVTLLSYCKDREYRLYVIIDEYDNFANTILSDSGKQAYLGITRGEGFFRAFFNVVEKAYNNNYGLARIHYYKGNLENARNSFEQFEKRVGFLSDKEKFVIKNRFEDHMEAERKEFAGEGFPAKLFDDNNI